MKLNEAKLKKWQAVVEFASDPERLAMLETLVSENGTTGKVQQERPERPHDKRWKEGTQIAAIVEAALACAEPFSGYQLAAKMQAAGHKFRNPDRAGLAVTDVLRTELKEKGVVRVHKKGQGGAPMLFERVV